MVPYKDTKCKPSECSMHSLLVLQITYVGDGLSPPPHCLSYASHRNGCSSVSTRALLITSRKYGGMLNMP